MKKLITTLFLLGTLFSINVSNCTHVHNEECGYNEETNDGCTHVHTDECYGIECLGILDPEDSKG